MVKLYFGEALGLISKTMPFIWARLGSYALLGLGLGFYFGVMGGISWLLASLWAPLGVIMFLLALGGAFGVVRWATRYYFYLLRAAHTAVMTEFILGNPPQGSQLAYGKAQVTSRFRDTSLMFGVDALVDGVVKAFTRRFANMAGLLPIPGLESLMGLLQRVAISSTTYIDEAILSRAYAEREANVWKVARDGVVLYAQAWKPVLANAVALALLSYVQFVGLLVVLGLPAVALGAALPELRVALGVGVILGAWMIKLAVGDAFSLAATLLAFHGETAALKPNEEWVARLDDLSPKFRELGQKAAEAFTPAAPPKLEPVAAGLEPGRA